VSAATHDEALVVHAGGCHCGAVAFEVDAPARPDVLECTCSVCSMTGFLHLIVPRERFRLLRGADRLAEYRFGTGTARHLFCTTCGVKSFYVPRSHPDGYSVNVRCITPGTLGGMQLGTFDGRHWEAAAARAQGEARTPQGAGEARTPHGGGEAPAPRAGG
jgi:hypothetical protein